MLIDAKFLIRLFLRRLHYFLLVAIPVTSLGLWLAFNLPESYDAQARLLVESPQVPSDLAASTMRAESAEVLQVISQRIQTRSNMLDLSRQFRLYADQPELNADAIVSDMRRRVRIDLPRRTDAASFITVSFAASDPRIAAEVTNVLVTQILEQNVALRTATTTQTLEFFDEELERLEEDLNRQASRIVTFQEANRNALPDSLAFRRARQTTLQERLLQIDREMAGLRDRRERMIAFFERTGRVEMAADTQTPEQRRLQELQNDLASALVVFSPDNPRIRLLRSQISALEEAMSGSSSESEEPATMSLFEFQLSDIEGQMEFLAAQKEGIEAELEELRLTIEATPANMVALASLERDYDNIQTQYNQAVARRAQARVGERIEAQSRGQRITVVEQATPPEDPSRPNRRAIAMAGVGGGVGLGFAVVTLIELLRGAVRRPADITARMGVAPFASVPYLRTRRQIVMRRATIAILLVLGATAVPVGLWQFDQHVMPLDRAVDEVVSRSGLDNLLSLLRK